jgi:cytochrome c553
MRALTTWITRAVMTLLTLIVLLAAAVFARSTMIRTRHWEVPPSAVAALPTDANAIAEGGRLARILGCDDCHGREFEGRLFFSERHVADLVAPNLSRLMPAYSDAELARAIRHGVRPDGTGLFVMPSASFYHLSDGDLGRLMAFLRRQPQREGYSRNTRIGPIGHIGIATRRFQTVAATMDHHAARVPRADLADRVARGKYLALVACTECHGLAFEGGLDGKAPPLVIASAYTEDAFRHLLRTGEPLAKRDLYLMDDVARLRFAALTDEEISALHAFLMSLTAR